MNFEDFPKQNKGFVKALLIIEILSRKAFVYMQKSFKMAETIENYKKFLAEMGDKVISVAGDNDFSNKQFLNLNKERGITVFHDVAADDHITRHGNKLGILDRFCRTIKNRLRLYMDVNGPRYCDALPDLVENYNNTMHASLQKHTPNQVFESDKLKRGIRLRNAIHNDAVRRGVKCYMPGTAVRILEAKKQFGKETSRFSATVYTVDGLSHNRSRVKDGDVLLRKLFKE